MPKQTHTGAALHRGRVTIPASRWCQKCRQRARVGRSPWCHECLAANPITVGTRQEAAPILAPAPPPVATLAPVAASKIAREFR